MEEDNNIQNQPIKHDEKVIKKKPISGWAIVGYNLLVLIFYTLILKIAGDTGLFVDAIILLLHVLLCFGLAIGYKSWWWCLSAILVLIIGFSTCVMIHLSGI